MTKYLGVSKILLDNAIAPPISTSASLPAEEASTGSLLQTLRDAGLFESEEEAMSRYSII